MLKRCLAPGCHTRSKRSYCPLHQPYQGDWQSTSSQILRRDYYRCFCPGCASCQYETDAISMCLRPANTVDHVDGNALNSDPENLRAMCRPCNTAKGGIA